jgi:hypothetical protein
VNTHDIPLARAGAAGAKIATLINCAERVQPPGDHVQLSIIGLNFVYAILGVVLMWVSYRIIDRLTPQVDFPAELKKGNIAVAIFIAALFVSIALIVGHALN